MRLDNNTQAFLALVRAGLWEKEVQLSQYNDIDYSRVQTLAEEQSVVGLVAAGFEHVVDTKVPKENLLQFVGQALQLEQRNLSMNLFVAEIVNKLREKDIYSLLVKGQGVAQCYERPLWRSCGDVDFLLDDENYRKAKVLLVPLAQKNEREVKEKKHLELTIDGWIVELHGSMRGNVLKRIDGALDKIQCDVFSKKKVRVWSNVTTEVYLPAPTEDSLFVFTHILQHFTQGGIGLRQVCDWCRLLWKYRDDIDKDYLKNRLEEMRLMSEWKVFGAMTVEYLGMPMEAMPFYSDEKKRKKKAERLIAFIMKTGNMGANRDLSYYERHSYVVSKLMSLEWHTTDAIEQFAIFPMDSVKIWGSMLVNGVKRIMNHR